MKQIGQVYIHEFNISIADQREIFDLILRERTDNQAWLGCQTNGFVTEERTYSDNVLSLALNRVLATTEMLLNELSGTDRPVKYWFVGLDPGGSILWHDHSQSDWSSVFYPHNIEQGDGGNITFNDGTTIRPSAGLLVLFRGCLVHKVRAYHGVTPRLSIAFSRGI